MERERVAIDPNWEVSVQDVKTMREGRQEFLLLDVRNPDEYAICKIEGAQLVPLGELGKRLDEVKKLANGKPVVAHCHHGGRSLNAAAMLREAGMAGAKSMAGGIDAWSLVVDPKVARY
jgi:rhodanese-related sulfurtransferase